MSPPRVFTLSVTPVSFNNLYHCISSLVMLLSNTQVSDADAAPSHAVTSSGSLITVVENYTVYLGIF